MGNAYRSVLALKPTGDAVPANVLAGKTFSNADGAGKTGTMANNGAVSITLTDQNPTYTIPEGYHNGLGVVGFTTSGGDGASLIVTCGSAFSGTIITCSDGSSTYQKTCPSQSPYEVVFESISVGTWTITGTVSGQTYSTQYTVNNFETVLESIPEGDTVTPTDNVQIWLHCANIWNKNYSTISEILSDASTLQSLISSNNAVDYMARSTTWSSAISADSSAMTYIGVNDYCADKLLSESTWFNAICNSIYFENVLNICVPTMTSNTTPSGEAFADNTYATAGYEPYKAFDKNHTTRWNNRDAAGKIGYKFDNAVCIKKVVFIPYRSTNHTMLKEFKIQASNGETYNDLTNTITLEDVDYSSGYSVLLPNNNDEYLNYALYAISSYQNLNVSLYELQFYGR